MNDAVVAQIQRIRPRYIVDDRFAWLNSLLANITNRPAEDISRVLAEALARHYQSIIAFHATRADSPADFLNQGIRLSDLCTLEQMAIQRFGDNEQVKSAVAELRASGYVRHNHGRIFFFLTKRACLRSEHTHYLLNGSEYLAAVANRIGESRSLRSFGKPLIVESRIPAAALDTEFWLGRSYAMLEDYVTRLLDPQTRRPVASSCVVIKQPISPDNILRVHEFVEANRKIRLLNMQTGAREDLEEPRFHLLKIWNAKT